MPDNKKPTALRAVVVTGGSSGIGEACVKAMISLNPDVMVFNLSRTKPADNFGERLKHAGCDLSEPSGVAAGAAAAEKWLRTEAPQGPMLLLNNSGFGCYGPFPEPGLERNLAMLRLNAAAPVDLTARLLPLLRERGGWVVNVASTAAFQPTPCLSAYGATKAFLMNWSLALDDDLKGSGVRVMALCPGPTASAFFRNAGFSDSPVPGGVGQSAEQVAEAMLRGLRRERTLVVSGWQNQLLTFFSSRLPRVLVTRLSGGILRRVRKGSQSLDDELSAHGNGS